MWPNPQFPADLVTFIEEILNAKIHFLCSEISLSIKKMNTCIYIFSSYKWFQWDEQINKEEFFNRTNITAFQCEHVHYLDNRLILLTHNVVVLIYLPHFCIWCWCILKIVSEYWLFHRPQIPIPRMLIYTLKPDIINRL